MSVGGRSVSIGVAAGMNVGTCLAALTYSTAWAPQNLVANALCGKVEISTVEAGAHPSPTHPPSTGVARA